MDKSRFATLCGAIIYAFCGFSLFAVRHPFFINAMIYIPLLFIGIDNIYKNRKPFLFVFMICLSAISNFYFFYMLSILVVIYAVIRFLQVYKTNIARNIGKSLLRFSLYYMTGLLMSCVVFLPVAMATLETDRASVSQVVEALYGIGYYQRFFASLITHNDPRYWSLLGYSPVALAAVVSLFSKRKENTHVKAWFLLLTAFLLLPLMGHILNGFSYVTNRWVFGYSFVVAFITVIMMPDILKPTKKQLAVLTVFSSLYFLWLLTMRNGRQEDSFVMFATLLITILLMYVIQLFSDEKCVGIMKYASRITILVIIICGVTTYAYYLYSPLKGNYINEFTDYGQATKLHLDNGALAVKGLGNESFYRFEENRFGGQTYTHNSSTLINENSTNYYWSLVNPHISEFLKDDLYYTGFHKFFDLDARVAPTSLAGVRYYVIRPDLERYLPYGYEQRVFSSKRFSVYENSFWLPLGYTYDSMVPKADYITYEAIKKQQALLQGAVINNAANTIPLNNVAPVFDHIDATYEVSVGSGIEYKAGRFIVRNTSSKVTLSFEGLPDSETYLCFNNLYIEQMNPQESYSKESWEKLSLYEQNTFIAKNLYWTPAESIVLTIRSEDIGKTFSYNTQSYPWNTDQHDFQINLGYSQDAKKEITIQFQRIGVYSFDSLHVYCQPMTEFGHQIDRLRETTLENVDIGTNVVTGSISTDKDKLLVFSIPYSQGWSLKIDDEKAELLNANTMFCGAFILAGEHDITLTYMTPYLMEGIALSVIGVCIFAIIIVYHTRKQKRRLNQIEGLS